MNGNGTHREMKYTIDGKTFYQLPLSLGQGEHLIKALRGVDLGALTDVSALSALLGANLPHALACVLIPDGVTRRDFLAMLDTPSFVEEQAALLHAEITIETITQVITDFFDSNPLAMLVDTLTPIASGIGNPLSRMMNSKNSTPSYAEETPQNGIALEPT